MYSQLNLIVQLEFVAVFQNVFKQANQTHSCNQLNPYSKQLLN